MSSRRALANLLALIRRRRLESELENEIRAHLQLAEDDARGRGLSPEEARQEARRSFGGIEQMKEEHRDRRSFRFVETLLRDFTRGLASLRRAPAFTAIVMGVLALGIGGTVAMFSVVDAVLLKPLPFPHPDRIVGVWEAPRPGALNATTAAQFLAWKRLGVMFESLSAEQDISAALVDSGSAARLSGKAVTADYFRVFATGTALGRTFTPEEDRPGAPAVIVLSHAAWQTYFGADPGILRRRVVLDGQSYQVVGILQPGAFDRDQTQFWKPLVFTHDQLANATHWLTVYGRLRGGSTLAQAGERMRAIYATLLKDSVMDEDRDGTIVVESLTRLLVGPNLQRSVSIAFGAVLLVLLIACANVANLLFAQASSRQTELAVRAALGAGRTRLVGQLITESLAICVLGGVLGVGVAYCLIRLATPLLAQSLPFTSEVTLNPTVLAFAAAIVLSVALLAGTLPALQATFGNLADFLKQSTRSSSDTHIRLRRTIVIGEVALSLILLCAAALLLRSLLKLQQLDTGIRIDNVLTMSLELPVQSYDTAQKAAIFYDAVRERVGAVPGVTKVAFSTFLPLHWVSNGEGMWVGAEKPLNVRFKRVDPGYFSALDIHLLAGRSIESHDRAGSPPVIVINKALATELAETARVKDPLGKVVRVSSGDYLAQKPVFMEVQIVGLIKGERTGSPGSPDPAVIYVPLAQAPHPQVKLLVRSHDGTAAIIPGIRKAIHDIDPNLPISDIATMQRVLDETLTDTSRPAWLIAAFAVIAVLLSAIGLYGVVSYSVMQRRRELGIRIALGAHASDVLSNVLRSALLMIFVGLALGLLGVFALTRILANLLFEVSPLDPLTLTVGCAAMVIIGLFAGFPPAYRAARFDPIVSLRDGG